MSSLARLLPVTTRMVVVAITVQNRASDDIDAASEGFPGCRGASTLSHRLRAPLNSVRSIFWSWSRGDGLRKEYATEHTCVIQPSTRWPIRLISSLGPLRGRTVTQLCCMIELHATVKRIFSLSLSMYPNSTSPQSPSPYTLAYTFVTRC